MKTKVFFSVVGTIFLLSFFVMFFIHKVNAQKGGTPNTREIQSKIDVLNERIKGMELPVPPANSLLICNFEVAGPDEYKWVSPALSAMLRHHTHYAPKELMYQPGDAFIDRVFKEDKLPFDYVPTKEKAFDFGKRLGTVNVLLGKIVIDGEKVKLESTLINLFSKEEKNFKADGLLKDLPSLVGKLGLEVVRGLGVSLSKENEERISKPLIGSYDEFAAIGKTFVSKDAEKNIEILKSLVEKGSNSDFTYYQLVSKVWDNGNFADALRYAGEARKIFPKHSRLWLNYCALLNDNYKKKDAEDEYRKLIKYDPGFFYAHLNFAEFLDSSYHWSNPDESLKEAKKVVEINPASAEARLNLAKLSLNQAFDIRAGKYFITMVEPQQKDFSSGVRTALDEGEIAAAIDSEYHAVYDFLISIYEENSMDELAEAAFEKAVQTDPDCIECYRNLQWLYQSGYSNQPEKVVALADRLVKDHPDNPEAYFKAGMSLLAKAQRQFKEKKPIDQERVKKVVALFRQGCAVIEGKIKKDPENASLYGTYAYWLQTYMEEEDAYHFGLCDTFGGECGRKMAALAEAAVKKSKNTNLQYYLLLGKAYSWVFKFKESVEVCKKALDICPEYTPALQALADAYLSMRDFQSAIPVLEKCLTIEPKGGYILSHLGWAYEMTGQKDRARQFYLKCLKLNLGNPKYQDDLRNRIMKLQQK